MQKLGLRVPEPHPKGSEKEYNGIFLLCPVVVVQKFCYHGNLMSHFSSLLLYRLFKPGPRLEGKHACSKRLRS